MSQPAARVSDMHTCAMFSGLIPHVGGPIMPPCAPTVLTGGLPQARVMDMAFCVGPIDMIAQGSPTVLVCGLPAARMYDTTVHMGIITTGCPTVLIGGGGSGSGAGGGGAAGVGAGQGGAAEVGGTSIAQNLPLVIEGDDVIEEQVRAAMIEAAREGRPFCEQCTRAALRAKAAAADAAARNG
jgi:uncharacterized Zn-binding protein involved in type VI secretion